MRNLITLLSFILITPLLLFSQELPLDKSYGDQGIFQLDNLPDHGELFTGLDKSGRFYIGFQEILNMDSIPEIDYRFFRVTEDGEFDSSLRGPEDLGIDFPITNEFSPIQRSISLRDEYIYVYNGLSNSDTPTVDVFTLNKEKITTLDLKYFPTNFQFSNLPVRLSNGLFYIVDNYKIRRYLESGDLDVNFGVNGVLDLETQWADGKRLIPIYQKDGSSGIYFTKFETIQAEEPIITYHIGKLDLDGTLDTGFGSNGYIDLPEYFGAALVFADDQDGILFTVYSFENLLFAYTLLNVDENGTANTSFGDGGFLIDTTAIEINNLFYGYRVPIAKLTDKSLLYWNLEYYYGVDSTEIEIRYDLSHYLPNGVLNTSFGEEGRLELDFLENEFIQHIAADDLGNVYILAYDALDSLNVLPSNYKLYKLDGEKLFGLRSTDSNLHDFKVLPNPTNGPISIQYSGPGAEDVEFQLYSAAGKLISKKLFISIRNNETYDLQGMPQYLPSGQYNLRILSKESNLSLVKAVIYID